MSERTTKFFIGCLPANTDQNEIQKIFEALCPDISNLKIKYRSNKICAGYGHFRASATPKNLRKLEKAEIFYKGRVLECRPFMKGKKLEEYLNNYNKRRLYLSEIPSGISDQELHIFFSKIVEIKRAYKANNLDKDNKQFGFVVTSTPQGALKLLEIGKVWIKGKAVDINESVCQKLESINLRKGEESRESRLETGRNEEDGSFGGSWSREEKVILNVEKKESFDSNRGYFEKKGDFENFVIRKKKKRNFPNFGNFLEKKLVNSYNRNDEKFHRNFRHFKTNEEFRLSRKLSMPIIGHFGGENLRLNKPFYGKFLNQKGN